MSVDLKLFIGISVVQPQLSPTPVSNDDVALVHPSLDPPPPYTPASTTSWDASAAQLAATEDLRQRQEELERKAAELQRREEEIQRNMQLQGKLRKMIRFFTFTRNMETRSPSSKTLRCQLTSLLRYGQGCRHHFDTVELPLSRGSTTTTPTPDHDY